MTPTDSKNQCVKAGAAPGQPLKAVIPWVMISILQPKMYKIFESLENWVMAALEEYFWQNIREMMGNWLLWRYLVWMILIIWKKDVKNKIYFENSLQVIVKKDIPNTRADKEHVKAEHVCLTNLTHPFLVKLYCCYQTPSKLFYAMEFLQGGELFTWMEKFGVFPTVSI